VWSERTATPAAGGGPLVVLGSDLTAPVDEPGTAGTFHGAVLESGIDNGAAYDLDPVADWDAAARRVRQFDIGASALFVSECDALIALGAAVNRTGASARLRARGAAVAAAIDAHTWNAADGVYENTLYNLTFHKRRMPTAFYPLLAGVPTPERAREMLPLLTSPRGFCVNATAHGAGDAASTFLLQFVDARGAPTFAACATDACVADALDARRTWRRVEALVQTVPAAGTTPLSLWAGAGGALATAAGDAPPAPGFARVRVEGHCFAAPAPARVPLSLWRRATDGAFLTCGGNPACAQEAGAKGFAVVNETMCWAFSA